MKLCGGSSQAMRKETASLLWGLGFMTSAYLVFAGYMSVRYDRPGVFTQNLWMWLIWVVPMILSYAIKSGGWLRKAGLVGLVACLGVVAAVVSSFAEQLYWASADTYPTILTSDVPEGAESSAERLREHCDQMLWVMNKDNGMFIRCDGWWPFSTVWSIPVDTPLHNFYRELNER